jgi:mono/diheme cytochrome c family protein
MSKKTFIVFGLVVVVLAALIPWLVFRADGDGVAEASVPAGLQGGKELFDTNCGACHTLYAAGTDGNFAPDLDELLAPTGPPEGPSAEATIEATEGRVLNAIENGVDSGTTPGRMPAGIVNETQAREVAAFVAHVAGQG